MDEVIRKKVLRYLRVGGVVAFLLGLFVWWFLHLLGKYSFMCFLPEICNHINVPVSQFP
jgi:hypothetical protein